MNDLLNQLANSPASIEFSQVMDVIANNYQYSAISFKNGDLVSDAGSNEGSCKIFYFAKLHQLSEPQTLALFGQYYREDVLEHPEGNDHGNIRNFMKTGWAGISFQGVALVSA